MKGSARPMERCRGVSRPMERCEVGSVGLWRGVTAVSRPIERCE